MITLASLRAAVREARARALREKQRAELAEWQRSRAEYHAAWVGTLAPELVTEIVRLDGETLQMVTRVCTAQHPRQAS